ncbi:MAG: hypothetical protein GC159_11770 [Phycisphaera sp.]|nr:hypothetical protein [Phycisphaera sp.]
MPIHPLPVLSEEEEELALQRLKPPKTVVVRYGYMKSIAELPYDGDQILGCGTKLVIRTRRGVEIAEMLTTTCTNSGCGSSVSRSKMLEYIQNSGGKQYPFTTDGRVLRVASVEDLNENSRIEAERPRYIKAAREAIRELDMPMKLIEAEPLFSRDRVVFYFTSEDRVDFRDLVKRLAAEMHVRIEMRQVGARDEARLVADYEKCGQQCCCKQFLKVLKPVSMKSAKIQKATLDPQKISGRCGRLMCCLRYEDETYDELRKKLPKRKSRVMTEDGPGIVISTQILTQLALVELDENRQRFAYPVESLGRDNVPAYVEPAERGGRDSRGRDGGGRDSGGGRGRGGNARGDSGGGGGGGDSRGGDSKRSDDRGSRSKRGRGRSDEPRRPKPGEPLQDSEVESREGDRADAIDENVTPNAEPSQSGGSSDTNDAQRGGEASGDGQPRKKRRRRRRGRGRGRRGGGDNAGGESSGGGGNAGGDGGGGGGGGGGDGAGG